MWNQGLGYGAYGGAYNGLGGVYTGSPYGTYGTYGNTLGYGLQYP